MGRLHILGLKKKTDKVSHEKFKWKLGNIKGLNGKITEYMKAYLDEREMRIVMICKIKMEEGNQYSITRIKVGINTVFSVCEHVAG